MADRYNGVHFVLANRHIIGPDGHLGLVMSRVYFDTDDVPTIEMLFAHLRSEGLEVDGIYCPPF